jgi:Fic family protein
MPRPPPARPYPWPVTDSGATTYQPFPPFADWAGATVDESSFAGYASVLDELRSRPDAEPLTRAVEVATRAAAIDTGAIEGLYEVDRGFTMTVARGVAAWEKVLAAREPVVRRSFEDAMAAYDFVLDLATTRTEVSEKAIREIHALICAGQETYRVVTSVGWQERPLPKGEYKDTPNNPTSRLTGETHSYAPPMDVSAEMGRLVRELRSPVFEAAHPILQAAWAHYAFVAVHPFADGNGRVARALASVFLYRQPGVPLVIFADQKDAYLEGLEEADQGRTQRFVHFVQERVADVIGLVQVSAEAGNNSTAASLASLRETFLARDGMPLAELDVLGGSLRTAALEEIVGRLAELDLPVGVERYEMDDYLGSTPTIPDGYRPTSSPVPMRHVGIRGLGVSASTSVHVVFTTIGGAQPTFWVIAPYGGSLPVELRDLFPATTAVLGLKLRIWADNIVARLLADFDAESRRALRDS